MEQIIQHLVENYGTLGVMVLAIGGLAFIIIKELRKSNKALIEKQLSMNKDMTNSIVQSLSELSQTLTDDLREQNTKLLDYFLDDKTRTEKQHNDNLLSRRNVTLEINNIINDLRISLGAKRVSVLEFHNSFANQTGFPFLKFTMTYEKFAKGCKPLQQCYQGVQFSAVCDVCEQVLNSNNHICVLNTIDEIEDTVPMLLHDIQPEVGSAIFKGIFNVTDNMLIGLICIEFKEENQKIIDDVEIISSALTIGELITLSKPLNGNR